MTSRARFDSDTKMERTKYKYSLKTQVDDLVISPQMRRMADNRCQTVTSVCAKFGSHYCRIEDLEGHTLKLLHISYPVGDRYESGMTRVEEGFGVRSFD